MALRSKAASKTEYNSRPFTKSNLAGRSFCLGVMPIPCPHFKITIVKRSQGQSAVAGAAYQSGERLFSEYDQKTKFYNKKKELVHAEVMLPSHAPPGFADRATLWNAVEAVENQWNSQLARRIVLAFPVEVPKEQYLSMIKEFCQEQFVSKGMISALKNIRKYIDMVLNKQQLSAPGGKTPEKESVLKKLNDSKAALEQKKSQTQPKESEHTL